MADTNDNADFDLKVPQKTVSSDDPQKAISVNSSQDRVIEFERKLNSLRGELEVLDRDSAILSAAVEKDLLIIAELERIMAPTIKRESLITEALKEISAKERGVKNIDERRVVEQERWHRIEEWYAIEQEKWQTQEQLETQRKTADEHRKQQAALINKENTLREEIQRVEIEEEKEKLHFALNGIMVNRIATEEKLRNIADLYKKAVSQFDAINLQEKDIEAKEGEVENLLTNVRSLSEERTLSEQRYTLEKERHDVEMSRWKTEDEITELGTAGVESDKILRDFVAKEDQIKAALHALESRTVGEHNLPAVDTK